MLGAPGCGWQLRSVTPVGLPAGEPQLRAVGNFLSPIG